MLQPLFEGREVIELLYLAITDHNIGVTSHNRCNQLWYLASGVLVISIRIDDNIRTEA